MERRHKVIYFDLDGTLVDYESDACHAFGKAAAHAIAEHPHLAEILTNQMFSDRPITSCTVVTKTNVFAM